MSQPRPLLSPPETEEQLLAQAQQLSGYTLGELAALAGLVTPENLKRDKGWIGVLLEIWLGASAGSKPEQDFAALGVELKTIPVDSLGRPLETTFVCVAPLTGNSGVTWETSHVRHKLKRVLWIPVEGERSIPLAKRRVGSPLLWSPNEEEDRQLREDWEELMDMIVLGQIERITARHGEYLQIRPKAANAKALTEAIGARGERILTLLEIVLGIDNIIFLSLVVAKLPTAQRAHARRLGLAGAMVMRLALLASIAWVTRLTNPLFTIFSQEISARDLILLLGGLFLIWKASKEIHESIEGEEEGLKTRVSSFLGAIVQIMLLDIIFSLDSVITAVGLSDHLFIMMAAVVIAVGVMMFAARSIGDFVERHPSVKMLALSFLILVGFTLILESFDIHVPKGYIYFAMFFSIAVESLNLIRNKKNPL